MGRFDHLPYVVEAEGFAMARFATLEEAQNYVANNRVFQRPGRTVKISVWAKSEDNGVLGSAARPTSWDHLKGGVLPDD